MVHSILQILVYYAFIDCFYVTSDDLGIVLGTHGNFLNTVYSLQPLPQIPPLLYKLLFAHFNFDLCYSPFARPNL